MSAQTIDHSLILQEGAGNPQIKVSLSAAYGPHESLVAAQTALESAFSSIANIPKGYTFCVIENNKPVEYWFIVNGVSTDTTPFAQQIERKQKEAAVDLSGLQFSTVTEGNTTYLYVAVNGGTPQRVGTLPTSAADITQIKFRINDSGQIQVNYDNGAAGSWQDIGARDAAGVKPLTDLRLSVDVNRQLKVDYGGGVFELIEGAVFNNSGTTSDNLYIIDYRNVGTLSYDGHTYTGQSAVDAMVAAGIDFHIQFNIWMQQQWGSMPAGSKVLFISTLVDKTGGAQNVYANYGNTSSPQYIGTKWNANGTATSLYDVVSHFNLSSNYYIYQATKLSSTMWTGLSWVGKILTSYYRKVPFTITRNSIYKDIVFQYDHDYDGKSGTTEQHDNLVNGRVTFTVSSAVPFKIYTPTTLKDDGTLFFAIKDQTDATVVSGTTYEVGNYTFAVEIPGSYRSEMRFSTDVQKPSYDGLIDFIGVDEEGTWYDSIYVHYLPYVENREDYAGLETRVKDQYTNSSIENAKVYANGVLLGRTDSYGRGPDINVPINTTVQITCRANDYTQWSEAQTPTGNINLDILMTPTIENSALLKIIIDPKRSDSSMTNVWIDDVNQSSQVFRDGVLERRISVGQHTIYITALNHQAYGPTQFEVLTTGYENEIKLKSLGNLTYSATSTQELPIPAAGGTINVRFKIEDNYETPCTITKVVPANSYDDFTVNSLTKDAATNEYIANITFAPGQGGSSVPAYIYFVGSDGTRVNIYGGYHMAEVHLYYGS